MSAIGFSALAGRLARVIGRPYIWQSWGDLRHSVTTGEPAFEHLHGVRLWEWRAERPDLE